jgi:hypothetical protein
MQDHVRATKLAADYFSVFFLQVPAAWHVEAPALAWLALTGLSLAAGCKPASKWNMTVASVM